MSEIDKLFKNNCKKCKYFDEEAKTCSYGSWDRYIEEAIELYLMNDVCTFEGDSRFIKGDVK